MSMGLSSEQVLRKEKKETQLLEHLLQLDLGEADSAGVSRYVVACVSQSELTSWRGSLERAGCVS
eukprot:COSAG02_NODE_12384_length_1555_cov_2.844780_4_plen_65_part_00